MRSARQGTLMANQEQCGSRISSVRLRAAKILLRLIVALLSGFIASPSAQAQFKTLYTFTGGADGGRPDARVITDAKGILYGTTFWGGNLTCNSGNGCGVIYMLTKTGKEAVLHRFAGGKDGAYPSAALIMDTQGNLYGTTTAGGSTSGCNGSGCGTVFRIDTTHKETVLHRFTGGKDGGEPSSALIVDKAGNFYGTTLGGGDVSCNAPYGCGVVYKLTATGKETVLHTFTGSDGEDPDVDSLAIDTTGNFYGTTSHGGDPTCACGVVFKLTTTGKETVLHTFKGGTTDGSYPLSGVTLDTKDNLYGTTALGGENNAGVLFKISNVSDVDPPANNFAMLYAFGNGASDGKQPVGGVIVCSDGKDFGSTESGGSLFYGTLWLYDELKKKETVLYNFDYSFGGAVPLATDTWTGVRDGAEFYGVASEGGNINGKNGSGVVHSETYIHEDTLCTQH
jgi:uncharacterized repeat protein (TIGR03803 family)